MKSVVIKISRFLIVGSIQFLDVNGAVLYTFVTPSLKYDYV